MFGGRIVSILRKSNISSKRFLSSNVPANLHLADTKIFEPVPVPLMKEENFYFPLVDVPDSIEVRKFGVDAGDFAPSTPLVKKIFEVPIRRDIINDVIKYLRNKRRQPHKTKRMSEISGSNKKPRPQKGTGSSQVGHRRNSSWVGGQKVHGPKLRDFAIKINRKVRALGRMMALAVKFREGNLVVFDTLDSETHKTKNLVEIMTAHGLVGPTVLFVDEFLNENFKKASANIEKAEAFELTKANVYQIMRKDKLVMSLNAFTKTQAGIMFQYTYSGKSRKLAASKQVLEQAAAFCDEEINGYQAEKERMSQYRL